ncbi:MAG: isoprenylcysteine carboxylmethyltransferase family protein [Bacteroidetes bacterium]|nr:isoprenylcysteine carboxylmethyltransferase family protein [Bacteroidota bacterium]
MNTAIKKDNPGVYIPPPLIYVVVFLISFLLQRMIPLDTSYTYAPIAANVSIVLIICSMIFIVPAVIQFIRSKNNIIPLKPASSLQFRGIYALSRNPMYFGLLLLYTGIGVVKGNWWTLILIPVLMILVHFLVIKREEAYLARTFGEDYLNYKKQVRRWI